MAGRQVQQQHSPRQLPVAGVDHQVVSPTSRSLRQISQPARRSPSVPVVLVLLSRLEHLTMEATARTPVLALPPLMRSMPKRPVATVQLERREEPFRLACSSPVA